MTTVQMSYSPCMDTKRAVTPVKSRTGTPVSQREVICVESQQDEVTSSVQQKDLGIGDLQKFGAASPKGLRGANGTSVKAENMPSSSERNTPTEKQSKMNEKTAAVMGHPSNDVTGSPCLIRASDQKTEAMDGAHEGRNDVVFMMGM